MKIPFKSLAYKLLIDPLMSKIHRRILNEVNTSDRVLDVACGTGALSIAISKKAKSVTGIDISDEMIALARRSVNRKKICNAAFMVIDASEMGFFRDNEFDLAVTSMAVHQFEPDTAVKVLKQMKRIASRVIITDYNLPLPGGFSRKLVWWIESLAGGDHYRNFKNYVQCGGLNYFLERTGLSIKSRSLMSGGIFLICVCEKTS